MPHITREGKIVDAFAGSKAMSATMTYSSGINIERSEQFGVWLCASPASAASANGITVWYEVAPSNDTSLYFYAASLAVGASSLSSNVGSAVALTPTVRMPWLRLGLSAAGSGAVAVANSCSAWVKVFTQ